MTEARHDLGRISTLRANAIGEPGSRQFRLTAASGHGSAILWMEKEQLFEMGVAIKRIIAIVEQRGRGRRMVAEPVEEPGELREESGPSLEFQVSSLAISYDEIASLYVITAHDTEGGDERPALVSLRAAQREMDALAEEAFAVCAAGRPRCVLCGGPLVPEPHLCPRHNGHVVARES